MFHSINCTRFIFLRCLLAFLLSAAIVTMAHEVPEAQQIALESCNELLPADTLVQRIENDLKAIRSQFPAVADLRHQRKWQPGTLLLSHVGQTTLGAINSSPYGPIQSRSIFQDIIFAVTFNKPYNPEKLAEILKRDFRVESAEPDGSIGISSTITLTTEDSSEKYTYVIMKGWGDCPSGCIHKHFWTFSTGPEKNSVKLIKERGDNLNDSGLKQPAVFGF